MQSLDQKENVFHYVVTHHLHPPLVADAGSFFSIVISTFAMPWWLVKHI